MSEKEATENGGRKIQFRFHPIQHVGGDVISNNKKNYSICEKIEAIERPAYLVLC